MSLNTSLLIGMQALEVAQSGLDAASNNIANANTPGYTREVPEFSENQEIVSGSQVRGGGVTLDGLKSVRDDLLKLQIQQQTSQESSADTQLSLLERIEASFSSASGGDVASALSAFSGSLTQLSASPTSQGVRQGVLSSGQGLANAFKNTSAALTNAQTDANAQVTQSVAQINSLSEQIAELNGHLSQLTATGHDGGTVQDQRDELVQQLSSITNVFITHSSDGATITTGSGTPLVMGGQSFALQTTMGSNGTQQVLDCYGADITGSLTVGQLGGAIQVRDNQIHGFLLQLNALATQVATAVNTAQTLGFDAIGNQGQSFFTIPQNSADAAAAIAVSIVDSSLIAASSDKSAGSNGNVANLSAALISAPPGGQTAAAVYASLVFQVGDAAASATDQSTAIGLNLQQLINQQSSISSVNLNEEATNLLRFQTAYEAAARVVSTIQQLNAVTLNMGTGGGY